MAVGIGTAATVLFLALVERLRRTFATRQEINGIGERVNALHTLYVQVRESTDDTRERAMATEAEQRRQWERITEHVIRPLDRITEKLEGVAEAQAAQAAALEHLGLHAGEAPRPGPLRHKPRRRP